jgi:hypothetical protein
MDQFPQEQKISKDCTLFTYKANTIGIYKIWRINQEEENTTTDICFEIETCSLCKDENSVVIPLGVNDITACEKCMASMFQAIRFSPEEMKWSLEEQKRYHEGDILSNQSRIQSINQKLKQMDLESSGPPSDSFFIM